MRTMRKNLRKGTHLSLNKRKISDLFYIFMN